VKGHAAAADEGHVVRQVSAVRQSTPAESAVVEAFVTMSRFPAFTHEKFELFSVKRVPLKNGMEAVSHVVVPVPPTPVANAAALAPIGKRRSNAKMVLNRVFIIDIIRYLTLVI